MSDSTDVLAKRAEFGPAQFCGWYGSSTGCKHGNMCHSSHGVIGVAAIYETLDERNGRLEAEAVAGVPLLKKRKPCRYFRREGGCNKGDACTFSHVKTACKFFFSQDGCPKGDACDFSHVRETCRHFSRRGGCNNGDACKYSHDLPVLATKVKDCPFFPSGCVNGLSCAYNLIGRDCAAVE